MENISPNIDVIAEAISAEFKTTYNLHGKRQVADTHSKTNSPKANNKNELQF